MITSKKMEERKWLEKIVSEASSLQDTNKDIEYIGSTRINHRIWDYYKDGQDNYWYHELALKNNEIVSMEKYIFGKEAKRR